LGESPLQQKDVSQNQVGYDDNNLNISKHKTTSTQPMGIWDLAKEKADPDVLMLHFFGCHWNYQLH
jgi:hypothetical protein